MRIQCVLNEMKYPHLAEHIRSKKNGNLSAYIFSLIKADYDRRVFSSEEAFKEIMEKLDNLLKNGVVIEPEEEEEEEISIPGSFFLE